MGHYYQHDGTPAYEVENKTKGGMRPATIADAKKNGWLTSFSSVKAIIASPQIVNYQLKCLSKTWWDLIETGDPVLGEDFERAHRLAKRLSEQDRIQAASFGTKVHKALEAYVQGEQDIDQEYLPFVKPAVEWLETIAPLDAWVCEQSFGCSELGFGGKVDLFTTATDPATVIDAKTQKFQGKPSCYDEWGMQLAAYRYGLGLPKADCYSLVISRTIPGLVQTKKWTEAELAAQWELFDLIRRFYFLKNNYNPEGLI